MKENKKLNVKKIVCLSLYVVTIAFLLVFIIMQAFFPKTAINVFGFKVFLISYTKSMEPVLNYNDLIFVKKYDFDMLEIGDIISFETYSIDGKKIVVTHTVNDIDEIDGVRHIQTKGVNIHLPDRDAVTEFGIDDTGSYLGKYAFKSEFLGNLIAFFTSFIGIFVIVVNVSCMSCIYLVLKHINAKKLEKNAEQNPHIDNDAS